MSASENDDLSSVEGDLEVVQEPETIENADIQNENQDEEDKENQDEEDKENQEGDEDSTKKTKVKRVRNPQPKLNTERLRGPRGLMKLQDVFKDVKFKGRGHEEDDLNLLMKNYEYWCHRLFPKFPFDDCLEKIERLGNRRDAQVYMKKIRMDLVDDEQPNIHLLNDDNNDSDSDNNLEQTQDNAFDSLLPQVPQQTGDSISSELTEEQLELIRINRERAQRLRQQMLIRNAEKTNTDLLNDQSEGSTETLSQSSSFSDVAKQTDFPESMSTETTSSIKPPCEAMSTSSDVTPQQVSVENMSISSETFISEMSVVPETTSEGAVYQAVPRQISLESMSVSSSRASISGEQRSQLTSDLPSMSGDGDKNAGLNDEPIFKSRNSLDVHENNFVETIHKSPKANQTIDDDDDALFMEVDM